MAASDDDFNQAGEPPDYDAFAGDPALVAAIAAFGAGWAADRLGRCGQNIGAADLRDLARAANRNPPELAAFDRFGRRIDQVVYHPAWHTLMAMIRADACHSLAWTANRPGAHVARAGLAYLWGQGEPGVCCPAAMTHAALAALAHAPALLARHRAGILATGYDPRPQPPGAKPALGVAMAMTEKQGGSDLRQTRTTATRHGERWHLTGHKWFFSVPTSDLFLTLARTDAGVTCFLAQGWRDDGARNGLRLQRLKDKLGNRANASAEVEFDNLEADMVGPPGRGIATIIEMAHLTRLDCAIAAAALMRHATSLALHHCAHRRAFQRALIDQPVMAAVLADMALEAEAALWLAMRAAAAVDAAAADPHEAALARLLVPIAKYWTCKRAPALLAEALECHGGNGFVEEHPIARLYREAPLNGVWEGAGNIICLDVLRALSHTHALAEALDAELAPARGADPALDRLIADLAEPLARPAAIGAGARRVVEHLALALAAGLLCRHAPPAIAAAYIAARIARPALAFGASTFGTSSGSLPSGNLPHGSSETRAVLARATVIPPA